jgi:TPR repeat protein
VVLAQWFLYEPEKSGLSNGEEAISLLVSASDAGTPEAQQVLAGCYLEGTVVEKDTQVSVDLLERAGRGGRLSAWEDLVHLFTDGRYMDRDVDRALQYAEILANAGFPQMKMALRAETLGGGFKEA